MARILIVDDSPTEQATLSRMLENHGHKTTIVANGNEALEKVRETAPDVILMDIVMPELNGFQATRKLSQDEATRHIPIIIVTSKTQETDKIWGMRQGAKGYLTKPVEEADLLAAIKAVLS